MAREVRSRPSEILKKHQIRPDMSTMRRREKQKVQQQEQVIVRQSAKPPPYPELRQVAYAESIRITSQSAEQDTADKEAAKNKKKFHSIDTESFSWPVEMRAKYQADGYCPRGIKTEVSF